jgi:hypothetical protein
VNGIEEAEDDNGTTAAHRPSGAEAEVDLGSTSA